MKAILITPGKGEAQLIDQPVLHVTHPHQVKIQAMKAGICGTDREEVMGGCADAPAGSQKLIYVY